MSKALESLFADCTGDDPYPDNLALPLVNLPGGVKASKWQRSAEK